MEDFDKVAISSNEAEEKAAKQFADAGMCALLSLTRTTLAPPNLQETNRYYVCIETVLFLVMHQSLKLLLFVEPRLTGLRLHGVPKKSCQFFQMELQGLTHRSRNGLHNYILTLLIDWLHC